MTSGSEQMKAEEPLIRRDYFSRWETIQNLPSDFALEWGYRTWAHALKEEVLPSAYTPRITGPAAFVTILSVLEAGVKGLPDGMMFDQLEDYAVFRGLQAYQQLTHEVGTVYRMSTPYPEQGGNNG